MRKFAWIAVACVAVAATAQAAPVAVVDQALNAGWNVGAGQPNSSFSGVRDAAFAGGGLELGLRAQQRFVGPYTPTVVASPWGMLPMYTVTTGTSSPNRTTWNYDFSVAYAGGVANLDNVTLKVDPVTGNLTDLADFNGTGAAFTAFDDTPPEPTQNSFNPGFNFLSGGLYDFNATGLYLVTLSATRNGQTSSTQVLINVGGVAVPAVPEPASVAVFGLLTAAGAAALRRRKASA